MLDWRVAAPLRRPASCGQHGGMGLDEDAGRAGLTGAARVTAGDRTWQAGDIDARYVIYSIAKTWRRRPDRRQRRYARADYPRPVTVISARSGGCG
jgi:hypothetical protein